MGLFDQFPYTNFHELNLDWLIKLIKELENTVNNFVALNTIKYADPIQWNITTQYQANTVVVDPQTGTAYLSSKAVPSGVALTNTDYWSVIFTLDIISANKNLTLRDDGSNVLATFASAAGNWLLWNGTLYKVSQDIAVNEAYVEGYNLTRYTVEMYIDDLKSSILNIIGDLDDLTTSDKDSIVDAINSLVLDIGAVNTKVGDLDDLLTSDKDSIVDAINSIINAAPSDLYYIANDYGITPDAADNTAALQTLIETASINEGVIVFKPGVYNFSSPLTLYRNNRLLGIGNVVFNYTNGTDSSTFITINDGVSPDGGVVVPTVYRFGNYPVVLDNIIFQGRNDVSYTLIPTTFKNAVCLQINTHEIKIANCTFKAWNNVMKYGNNSYLDTFMSCRFSHNNQVIYFDLSGLSNAGENFKFIDCVFGNNLLVIYNSQGMFFFNSCSIDYNYKIANSLHSTSGAINGYEIFTDCHIEDRGAEYDTPRFTNITSSRTYRVFSNVTFHSMPFPIYAFGNQNDEVIIDNCQFLFCGSDDTEVFSSNLGHVQMKGFTPSYAADAQIVKVNGRGGNLIDSTLQTFATNVTDGSATLSDDQLTLTSGGPNVTAAATASNIPIDKGHRIGIITARAVSGTYADMSAYIARVVAKDINGNVISSANAFCTSGSTSPNAIAKAAIILTDACAMVDVILRCPATGTTSSITIDQVNLYLC